MQGRTPGAPPTPLGPSEDPGYTVLLATCKPGPLLLRVAFPAESSGTRKPRFDGADFVRAPLVASAGERRFQPDGQDFARHLG